MAAVGHTVSGTRHLSAEQYAYIAAKYLLPAEEEKARERQAAALAQPGEKVGSKDPENLPARLGDARDLAAAKVGLSGKTVDAASWSCATPSWSGGRNSCGKGVDGNGDC